MAWILFNQDLLKRLLREIIDAECKNDLIKLKALTEIARYLENIEDKVKEIIENTEKDVEIRLNRITKNHKQYERKKEN